MMTTSIVCGLLLSTLIVSLYRKYEAVHWHLVGHKLGHTPLSHGQSVSHSTCVAMLVALFVTMLTFSVTSIIMAVILGAMCMVEVGWQTPLQSQS